MRLAAEGVRPDVVLTSPLLRARETGELVAQALGSFWEFDERLAPGATADAVRATVAERGDVVVIVGHQPDCGQIAAALTSRPEPRFPPAGVVQIDLP
jgi:phosphohistidine phosphatase